MVNEERAVKFLQNLIQIESVNPPGNELAVAEAISNHVESAGLSCEIKPFSENRANMIVRLEGKDSSLPALIFSGHLDTVPVGDILWEHPPFSGNLVDGKIYGRGACDMKSGVAALIEAMISLKEAGEELEQDVIFIGTAGEEVDCVGAKLMVEEDMLKNGGAMVVAEPSNGKVFTAHKGVLWLEIKLFGKTAHASMPDQGINAIIHMSELIERLKKFTFYAEIEHELLGKPSLTISTIEGGVKTNVVPDQCKITLDIRAVPGMEHEKIIGQINDILEDLKTEIQDFHYELNILHNLPALENVKNDSFVRLCLDVNQALYNVKPEEKGANYYTDASIFFPHLKLPTVIYGPGNERLAHQPNEYVEVNQYIQAIEYYAELARRYRPKRV